MRFKTSVPSTQTEHTITFSVSDPIEKGFLTATLSHPWDQDDYLLFPGAVYHGNRFRSLKKQYPPMYRPEETGVDMPITITDVPRLTPEGGGAIQLTTGDVSVPCIGVFSKARKQGILLFTVQEIEGKNLGISYKKGELTMSYPSQREQIYRWPFMTDESDEGMDFPKGAEVILPYRLIEFECEDLSGFYQVFFEQRKCMGLDQTSPQRLSAKEQAKIQIDKFNQLNWRKPGEFYGTLTTLEEGTAWQPGWIGGGMSSYAIMKLGGALEQERAIKTLEHLFRTQSPCGFFYESTDGEGNIGQSFHPEYAKDWHLLRKSGDILYFLWKHFHWMEQHKISVPAKFLKGTQALADAFVTLWERYGQFGQFVDLQSGDLITGGSSSCAMVPAGLVKAYQMFDTPKYLKVAQESAEQYYAKDLSAGVTTGGPGEILQCPDSESAFALLESFVVLYEETKDEKWLQRAREAAHFASSWVMSYNYNFPKDSEFARLDMKTIGTVFANAQNKHSAPGICTLSGDSLYKLYRWTGEKQYLSLLEDISSSIGQFMSTQQRPIYSWDVPKDATLLTEETTARREILPQGFICERVNTSDWEGEHCIGGVFKGSCWSEVANLLTLAEVAPFLWTDDIE